MFTFHIVMMNFLDPSWKRDAEWALRESRETETSELKILWMIVKYEWVFVWGHLKFTATSHQTKDEQNSHFPLLTSRASSDIAILCSTIIKLRFATGGRLWRAILPIYLCTHTWRSGDAKKPVLLTTTFAAQSIISFFNNLRLSTLENLLLT